MREEQGQHQVGRYPLPTTDSNIPEPPPMDMLTEMQTTIENVRTSSLMVSVDFLDLVDREGETKAWETLGKLKDLLG